MPGTRGPSINGLELRGCYFALYVKLSTWDQSFNRKIGFYGSSKLMKRVIYLYDLEKKCLSKIVTNLQNNLLEPLKKGDI